MSQYWKSIKLAQILLKIIACQKSHCMIVYLKYYDSGCKYIWAYIIYSNSYKPSVKMLNCSSTMPFVIISIIVNFLPHLKCLKLSESWFVKKLMKNNLSLAISNNIIVCNAVTDFSMAK